LSLLSQSPSSCPSFLSALSLLPTGPSPLFVLKREVELVAQQEPTPGLEPLTYCSTPLTVIYPRSGG
jgi:hypothetical protein